METAQKVIAQFESLPQKGKPLVRGNGTAEWTTLAGIVILDRSTGHSECVCLATGVKATPDEKLAASNGYLVHDMHAEILALRAFNVFLVEEMSRDHYLERYSPSTSDGTSDSTRYRLKDQFHVSFWVSELPCGDSSMESIQDEDEDWGEAPKGVLRGREYFGTVGRVRTKPGRRDSPVTLSKSCSDKLAMKQFTGITMGILELLVDRIYIHELITPPGYDCAVKRAFKGRIKKQEQTVQTDQTDQAGQSVQTHYFQLQTASPNFSFSQGNGRKPSGSSVLWVKHVGSEVVLNGVKMGHKPTLLTPKCMSMVSRQGVWQRLCPLLTEQPSGLLYYEAKLSQARSRRKAAGQAALGDWHSTHKDNFPL